MSITRQTRNASYRKLNPLARQAKILEVLGNKEMTSREIATVLGYTDMNAPFSRFDTL